MTELNNGLRKDADLIKKYVLTEAKKLREEAGVCETCDTIPCKCEKVEEDLSTYSKFSSSEEGLNLFDLATELAEQFGNGNMDHVKKQVENHPKAAALSALITSDLANESTKLAVSFAALLAR